MPAFRMNLIIIAALSSKYSKRVDELQYLYFFLSVCLSFSLWQYGHPAIHFALKRARNIFFFLVASFHFTHFLLLSQYSTQFCPFAFSLSFYPLPPFPSFSSSPLPYISFSFFPCFLPGKFEHFSYLPGSVATMLLRFFEHWP